MSRERRIAEILFGLLSEYVDLCDIWEDHNRAAGDKLFDTLAEEKEEHMAIQTQYMLPLMEKCDRAGFKYAGFLSIIPPAFETTVEQRRRMLQDMEDFVDEEYPK